MFTRVIDGHPYLILAHRREGKPRQIHLGRATADDIALVSAVRKQRQQARRFATIERKFDEIWRVIQQAVEVELRSRGLYRYCGEWRFPRSQPQMSTNDACAEIRATRTIDEWTRRSLVNTLGAECGDELANVTRQVAALEDDLRGPRPTALERLLAQSTATTWLAWQLAVRALARADGIGDHTLHVPSAKYMLECASKFHRRFIASAKLLARVRRLEAGGRPSAPSSRSVGKSYRSERRKPVVANRRGSARR
jgi:hypothetical protein